MKIFLAAPLFNEAERDFNFQTAKKLREHGFEVWMAQEAPFIQHGNHAEKKIIYEGDILALKTSDVVVAILDGVDVDSGVAYEMGYAKALGKPLVGLKTDYRTFSDMEEVNLMLAVSVSTLCKSLNEVIDFLSKTKLFSEIARAILPPLF
jgi:nucleoside 2-deoxyribosyltransferase